jgi:hypothetical protein
MYATAISNAVDHRWKADREKTYLEIVKRYDKEERMVFPELAADVVNAFEADRNQDFLGSVYMELGLGDHWK